MQIKLTEDEVMDLLQMALESEGSPIKLPYGTAVRNLSIATKGANHAVSFDLEDADAEAGDDD